jgi:hypothetical protein
VTEELKATITSKASRHCFGVDKDKGKDYGYFLVLTIDFENTGLKEKIIPTNAVTVFKSGSGPYYSNLTVPGDCDTSGMFADDEVKVLSWKHTEGELWFALGKEELKCGFDALLDKGPYGGTGVLVWNVPC